MQKAYMDGVIKRVSGEEFMAVGFVLWLSAFVEENRRWFEQWWNGNEWGIFEYSILTRGDLKVVQKFQIYTVCLV